MVGIDGCAVMYTLEKGLSLRVGESDCVHRRKVGYMHT